MLFTTAFIALLSASSSFALPGKPNAPAQPAQGKVPTTNGQGKAPAKQPPPKPGAPASGPAPKTTPPKSVFEWPPWYAVVIDKPPSGTKFTSISATLTIPTLKLGDEDAPGYGISAFIGLDGGIDHKKVLQLGVDMVITPDGAKLTTSDGKTLIIRPESEWYPDSSSEVTEQEFKLSFGDSVKLSVTSTSATGATVSIVNAKTGQKFSKNLVALKGYEFTGTTAEWSVVSVELGEGQILPPPNFGTLTFSNAVATTDDGKSYGPESGKPLNEGKKLVASAGKGSALIKYVPGASSKTPPKPNTPVKNPGTST